jgi:hypothetical protein
MESGLVHWYRFIVSKGNCSLHLVSSQLPARDHVECFVHIVRVICPSKWSLLDIRLYLLPDEYAGSTPPMSSDHNYEVVMITLCISERSG